MAATKRDFGSFHASNVEELVSLPDEAYVPPSLPFDTPSFDEYRKNPPQFGQKLREKHFLLDKECVFLNHGAFGGTLSQALDVAQKWQRHTERQPLRFFDRELLPHLVHVTRRMASFVGCSPGDLVLIQNVTTAINCVVRSQNIKKGETVYMLNLTYGAVKKLITHVCENTGATIQEEKVILPLQSQQQIVDLVDRTLKEGTKLAIFDHIPSNTPFILPIKQLIQICHNRGVPVLIDGAHALGSLTLDLDDLDPDFYVSNCHKWLCSPKGAAVMYVKQRWQHQTRPLIISHGLGSGFISEFIWAGLRDYSPLLSIHTVLDFWDALDTKATHCHLYNLAKMAANTLKDKWKSNFLAPLEMFGTMVAVQLPLELYKHCEVVDYTKAEIIQNYLYEKNIEVPIKAIQGHLYVRISVHVYNELKEYEHLGELVLNLTREKIL
ncbi:unnamed protein product [Owenia fusiformis]|uniref:Aminotransferase class V domain-containing protein n=1 Tax=Owenia fusiformis TaxID=6347 RepID=A0A8J1TCK9_OWEFU|nr:unnamed protein product [Owenia fusiformis]